MADVPFLGCKISLISKCDIRYEGILYCVDAKESTIALSKVKSYGTETRGDPSCYVAPKNEVYDIIIFRASDVKDLRVDAPEPPGLSDPAIISAHHSYPAQSPSTSSFSNTNNSATNNLTTNNITPATSSGTGIPPTLNSNVSLPNLGSSSGQALANQQKQQQQRQHQKPLLPFLPTGAKDQQHPNINNQASQQQQQSQQPAINYSSAVTNSRARVRPETREKRPDVEPKKPHELTRDNNRRMERRPGDKRDDLGQDERRDDRPSERRDDRRNDRRHESRNGTIDRKVDERRDDGARHNRFNNRNPRGTYDNRNHVGSNVRYNNNNNSNYQPRRRPSSRDHKGGGEGGGRSNYRRPPMYNQRRARSGDRIGAPRPPRKSVPLKFEGEYDFEVANKLFLELDGKFKNLKLKGDERDGESSGDGITSKSPAGHSESGSGYDSEDHNNKDRDSKDGYGESVSGEFYDRTKSFFDSISCEASERSQGKVNKTDWRKERQTNTETFGVSTSYRSRGGYRGRVYGANGYHRR